VAVIGLVPAAPEKFTRTVSFVAVAVHWSTTQSAGQLAQLSPASSSPFPQSVGVPIEGVAVGVNVALGKGLFGVDVGDAMALAATDGVELGSGAVSVGATVAVALGVVCSGVPVGSGVSVAVAGSAPVVAVAAGVGVSGSGVGLAGQPFRAAVTAPISSSMVTSPLWLGSNGGQLESDVGPREILTPVMSSPIETLPSPSQSPTH